VAFRVGAVCVIARADEHRRHDQEGDEHDDVVAVIADGLHDALPVPRVGSPVAAVPVGTAARLRLPGTGLDAEIHVGWMKSV